MVPAAGNNDGYSSGSGSSGGSGGCNDKDIGGYSDGGGHRQKSIKSGRGGNGGGDGCGKVTMTATTRTMTAMMVTEMMVVLKREASGRF